VQRRLPLLLALTALVAPSRALAYDWPLRPFDSQHAVRGFFNDPRREYLGEEEPRTSFHFGIDISAADLTPVYATEAGVADVHARSVSLAVGGGHRFGYWHVLPTVEPGEHVERHQLIAHVEPGWRHLHFAESVDGVYVNPLRPGGLAPYVDTTSPTIASVSIMARGRPADLDHVRGAVDLLCDAFDTPPLAPPGPWRDTRATPVLIRWRVTAGEHAVLRWQTAVDFRYALMPEPLFDLVYGPETRQNRANRPGHFSFYLAHGWRTSALADGAYRLQVLVADAWGNSARASLPFTVANGR
jgi:hypothetical protein